ncbi:iron chelate uptake ABC transporter family permease subunit [Shimia biformata]|uniref:iron chelate uptake ABC transporter family permease subunit n=1 Tax=Shimia biformata TaxID=1294299 RepID=UPI0019520958|nr:iron chelate uptake ABC transporter family permease subunit [Shimia biformata]
MAERRLIPTAGLLLVAAVLYMTLGAGGNWGFVLPFRGAKLVALLLVGVAISTSTVLFQTITRNRILTPSIMGFDALYVLLLTGVVYGFGGQAYLDLPPQVLFLFNVVLLVGASLLLFGTLLGRAQGDLMRLILTGIIFGTLFSSVTGFFQRLIDPNEFAIVQVSSYARFTRIETDLLAIASLLVAGCLIVAWRLRHQLDVLALGPKAAVNLGVDPRRGQLVVLTLIAVLVSVSTALVGPVVFLGLLVVSLAHLVTPSAHHAVILPAAAMISAIVLVAGQTIMERVLSLATPLSVVVDFVGGLVFLGLLLKGLRR